MNLMQAESPGPSVGKLRAQGPSDRHASSMASTLVMTVHRDHPAAGRAACRSLTALHHQFRHGRHRRLRHQERQHGQLLPLPAVGGHRLHGCCSASTSTSTICCSCAAVRDAFCAWRRCAAYLIIIGGGHLHPHVGPARRRLSPWPPPCATRALPGRPPSSPPPALPPPTSTAGPDLPSIRAGHPHVHRRLRGQYRRRHQGVPHHRSCSSTAAPELGRLHRSPKSVRTDPRWTAKSWSTTVLRGVQRLFRQPTC